MFSTKEAILKAAVDLFRRKGYMNTSMDDIAEEVGLTKGGLYHHIEKKEDLLTAIHDEVLDAFFSRVRLAIKDETDPIGKLGNWVQAHVSIIKEYQAHSKVFFTELDNIPEDKLRGVLKRRDLAMNMLREILVSGIAAGQFKKDIDPTIVSLLIFGMINWLYMWYNPKGPVSSDKIVEDINKLLRAGIAISGGERTGKEPATLTEGSALAEPVGRRM